MASKYTAFSEGMEEYCKNLPKIELHAHLNGSLSPTTLKELGCLNESVSEYQKLNKILEKTPQNLTDCFSLFKVAHDATNIKENVYAATKEVIKEFHADNVIYLELRTTPRSGEDFSKQEYIETVIKAIKENNQADITVKLILCIDRRHDTKTSNEAMNVIIEMKNKYPRIIKGVDLCGNPNEGQFEKQLFEKARNNNLKVTLHCAEVKNDEEALEMFRFKPDRIGHGTCIHLDSGGSEVLWEEFQMLQIPIECCLTSNVICGTSKSYNDHHLKELIKNNVPFTISTDDKGVFCTDLSKEYYLAYKYFNLSKEDLWNISFCSAEMIFDTDDVKNELKCVLEDWKLRHVN